MSVLLKFYAAALIIMLGLVVMPLLMSGTLPEYFRRMGRVDMIGMDPLSMDGDGRCR